MHHILFYITLGTILVVSVLVVLIIIVWVYIGREPKNNPKRYLEDMKRESDEKIIFKFCIGM
jgi:hypothetical protein